MLLGIVYGTTCLCAIYWINDDPVLVLNGCFIGICALLYSQMLSNRRLRQNDKEDQ